MARKKAKKRFRLVRFLTKFVVTVLVLIGIALVGLVLLPAEKIAGIAAARFEAATGRAMLLEGEVRPSLYPQLGVKTGRVSIANADWSEAGPLLQADSLAVGVDLAALIGGDIRITEVQAVGPKILLEIGADGRGNWEFGAAKAGGGGGGGGSGAAPAEDAAMRQFSLDRAEITSGAITFVDHRTGAARTLSALDAVVTLPDFAGAATISASAKTNAQGVALEATIAEFAAFLSDGAVPVVLAADIGGARLGFDGRAGLAPLAATGVVEADLGDMAGLFAALGLARPELPAGLGRNDARLSGDVTYAEDRVSLRGGTLQLDQNRLVGSADLTLAGKPNVVAKLQTGVLDLSGLTGESGGGGGGGDVIRPADGGGSGKRNGRSGTGWSKAPIDASALGLVDADLLIEADKVALGTTDLGRTNITLRLADARAEVDIRELNAFEGAVSGTLVANGRSGLSVSADLAGRAIALKPLLSQIAGYERLIAAGDMTIDVLGSGATMDAIMNSLNGTGSFRIGAGELQGLDLVGMLRNLDTSYVGEGAKTIFEEITGTFRIMDGVLINNNLSLISPLLSAQGKGEIGLGGQTLDYLITPRLLAGEGKGLSIPLRISGSWASPKFQLDMDALAGDKIDAARDRIEEKAREAVEKKVQEELGIDLGGGDQKLSKKERRKAREDARKALEEKAREGLLDLLGGN